MSFRNKFPLLALGVACAAPLAAGAPMSDASTAAAKEFRDQINVRIATLRTDLETRDALFRTDLDALRDDVDHGVITPSDAHMHSFDLVHELDADLALRLRTFTDGVEFDASAHLNEVELLDDFVVGRRHSLVDEARRRATVLRDRSTARDLKRLRLFTGRLEAQHRYYVVVDRRDPVIESITPSATVTEALGPFIPLRIDLLVGGSDRDLIADGRVCLAGTADEHNSPTVDVSILLPGGTAVLATATVDVVTRRWSVCFPETGPGDLPEGNYSVTITQSGVSLSDSLGVQ